MKAGVPNEVAEFERKTGKSIADLILSGKSDEEIKGEFRQAGLHPPNRYFLRRCRGLYKGPKELSQKMMEQFKNFLKNEVGIETLTADYILNAIIQKGVATLLNKEVSIPDLLKAIELQKKIGPPPGKEIQKKIDQLLKGKNELAGKD